MKHALTSPYQIHNIGVGIEMTKVHWWSDGRWMKERSQLMNSSWVVHAEWSLSLCTICKCAKAGLPCLIFCNCMKQFNNIWSFFSIFVSAQLSVILFFWLRQVFPGCFLKNWLSTAVSDTLFWLRKVLPVHFSKNWLSTAVSDTFFLVETSSPSIFLF